MAPVTCVSESSCCRRFKALRSRTFRSIIRDVAEAEIATWTPGAEFAMRERMRALTFEVICRAVFGVTEPARVERLRRALLALLDLGSSVFLPGVLQRDLGPWSPGGRLKRRLGVADSLLYEEIELRRREPDLDERTDVLSLLLRARDEDGEPMSDAELRDELITLLAAGHETTATGLAFAFDLLLHNPAVLARLRDDLEAGSDAYLEAVVTETLRLRPVIDAAERTLTKPRMVAGYELPAGHPRLPGNRARPHARGHLPAGRASFAPNAFSTARRSPTRGCPSGAASAAASEPRSRRPRWPR